ncbi:hypothetical protein M3181_00720 [Mesobacillus maritimus]|uniref:hypothetical protein n=2 Tax=Mesobacillus maritimus TaxID=1643336 RepID=UPI0020412C29|nr:hypothetical protein [Mesobacillus maritimus]MCM3667519.1 hypothetical protein [Mesobacillus maritimus]
MYTLILLLIMILGIIYVRYIPVKGVKCTSVSDSNNDSVQLVDIREYNQSYKHPIPNAVNIPIAYLKRHIQEITGCQLHVIASDSLEKNIGIRLLRKKGYNVVGYTLIDNHCLKNKSA